MILLLVITVPELIVVVTTVLIIVVVAELVWVDVGNVDVVFVVVGVLLLLLLLLLETTKVLDVKKDNEVEALGDTTGLIVEVETETVHDGQTSIIVVE